jgi:hypothetical protein
VKLEVETRAAAAAVVAQQALSAALARAEAAEAELARRVLLLDAFAEATAAKEAAMASYSNASQRVVALESECDALRLARKASDEAAAIATARADAAESVVATETARTAKAEREKWASAEALLEARVAHMPLELTLARAEAVGAAASAAAAQERLAVESAAAERSRGSLQRALHAAEADRQDWKARAHAWEAVALRAERQLLQGDASDSSDDAQAPNASRGRLRATIAGVELRRLLAQGPSGAVAPALDAYSAAEAADADDAAAALLDDDSGGAASVF